MSRDYAFEALAEVTDTDWNTGRGELNAALKSIREESDITDSYVLADEIHQRAKAYREVMPEVMLTPSSLAKHWKRVAEEARRPPAKAANLHAAVTDCQTCGGDRFVVVSLRKPAQSVWMTERGLKAQEDQMIEEYAGCPDCNPGIGMDPERARAMMRA
jgi:hypothetical protein